MPFRSPQCRPGADDVVDTVRMKRPVFSQEETPTGRVTYDDRGNAVWQWRDDEALIDELAHPKLAIDDDYVPPPLHVQTLPGIPSPLTPAPKAKGFNPYESGPVTRTGAKPKKDLRALSEWIELKKRRGEFPGK
jgi:hypothetical protein